VEIIRKELIINSVFVIKDALFFKNRNGLINLIFIIWIDLQHLFTVV